MDGKNIKVTRCNEHEIDYETTIFIGNLPRKVKDQELWDMFKDIGKIKSVRVIRNKENFEAIGVGYVRFETKT
jgi:RNA recognition motif-containing protein